MSVHQPTKKERFNLGVVEDVSSHYISVEGISIELVDRLMLTITALQCMAENGVLNPPGAALSNRKFSRCALLAADGVARAIDESPTKWFGLTRLLCRKYAQWVTSVKSILHDISQGDDLPDYPIAVAAGYHLAREKLGLKRDVAQWKRATKRAMGRLRMLSDDQCENDGEIKQSLDFYKHALYPTRGGFFRSFDGRLFLGDRQVRDGLSRELGIKIPPLAAPKVHGWERVEPGGPGDTEDDVGTDDLENHPEQQVLPFEGIDRQDQVRQVREALALRQARAKRGSVLEVAAKHYWEVRCGRITIRKLARRTRTSRSALQEAFVKLDADLRRDLSAT